MFNYLHGLIHRPERGWDPVSKEHARAYADEQWERFNPSCLDPLESRVGGFAGKRILDLGGGPGQYSVAFAQRGALVTWHDVSRNHLEYAQMRAEQQAASIHFSLGYLEEAQKFCPTPFDLVFCRICWRYCRNDREFARLTYSLVAPGGIGYIDTEVGPGKDPSRRRSAQHVLNAVCGWKIGHPDPPRGRLIRLFKPFHLAELDAEQTAESDRIFFRKKQQSMGWDNR